MTGLCQSFVGLSLTNDSLIACWMSARELATPSRLRGADPPAGVSTCISIGASDMSTPPLEELAGCHEQLLEDRTERVRGEEGQRSHDHDDADQKPGEQRRVGREGAC